jgi:SPP1 gp7 family putative phage head morphogenesis protein
MDAIFLRHGFAPLSPYRIETIFRTNLQSAYQAGRYRQLTEPAVMAALPYWRYVAVLDGSTRPEHAALHGKIYPANHPFWKTWYPPNGFNCRCTVVAVSKRQIEANGWQVETTNPTGGPVVRRPARLSERTWGATPDLNAIAAQVRRAQQAATANPSDEDQALVVDDRGQVNFARDADKTRPLSTLSQETFASWRDWFTGPTPTAPATPRPIAPITSTTGRAAEEARIVTDRFPRGTIRASDGRFNGWVYNITNEFDDQYRFFVYFDPAASLYRVALLKPDLSGHNGHESHLFTNGVICLNQQGGCCRMEEAFARSALWCRGASMVQRGHGFQFNSGQNR